MELKWSELETVINVGVHTLLYGPPGTGKTHAAQSADAFSITLTAETPAAELRGHYVPKGNEFVWQDGPAITAWRKGCTLVLNEIDQASGDALTFLHAILDDPTMAQITLPTGETVRPTEGFRAIATMNGVPADLPPALLDRFMARVVVNEPHPDALQNLTSAATVRATIGKTDESRVSLRQAKAFDYLTTALGEELACRAVFGARAKEIHAAVKLARADGGVTK